MGATTLLRSSSLAVALVLTGCATGTLSDNYCGIHCSVEKRDQAGQEYIASPQIHGAHYSPERREAARSRQAAGESETRRRITTAGPDLAVYGPVGEAGYLEVIECKRDVSREVPALEQRERFLRKCYDLLPVQHRQAQYESDQRVPLQDPPVIIVVPDVIQKPIRLTRGYKDYRRPGSLRWQHHESPSHHRSTLPAYPPHLPRPPSVQYPQ